MVYPALQVRPPSINLPGAMRAAQDFRTGQSRNRLVEGQLGQLQQRAQARREYAPGALAGNQDALQNWFAEDPKGASEAQEFLGRASEQEIAAEKEALEEVAAMAMWTLYDRQGNENPLPLKNSRWQYLRNSDPKLAEAIPETFDPMYASWAIGRIMAKKQLLDQAAGPQAPAGMQKGLGGALENIPGYTEALGERAEATRAPAEPADDQTGFAGKALEAQYQNAIMEYNAYVRAGQQPPQEVTDRAVAATHSLNQPRMFRDEQGRVWEQRLGTPPGMATPPLTGATPQAAAPVGGQGAPPPPVAPEAPVSPSPPPAYGGRAALAPGLNIPDFTGAEAVLNEIATIMEEAQQQGERLTGVVGAAKRVGGPIVRQIPGLETAISGRSSRLANQLELLTAKVAPLVIEGGKLSNEERARAERIVGQLSAWTDDVELRSRLSDLASFLNQMQTKYGGL